MMTFMQQNPCTGHVQTDLEKIAKHTRPDGKEYSQIHISWTQTLSTILSSS